MVGNVITGGICGFVAEINKGNKDILPENFEMSADLENSANRCLYPDSDGNMNEVINKYEEGDPQRLVLEDNLNTLDDFIDGFSVYAQWKSKTEPQTQSQSILDFTKDLKKYQEGGIYDVDNVKATLERFNSLVNCDNKKYKLQNTQCENEGQCLEIVNINTFQAPDCATSKNESEALFQTLKNYQVSQNQYIDSISAEIGDELKTNSSQERYSFFKKNLIEI